MKKRNRNYSPSFKQKAVELSYARGNTKQVCEELDIPYSVLHRWRKESQEFVNNLKLIKVAYHYNKFIKLFKALRIVNCSAIKINLTY